MPGCLNLRRDVKLSRYTTFRIGGPADFFIAVKSEAALRQALAFAREQGIPVLVIGGGSNLLVCDQGFRGLVIRNSIRGIKHTGTILQARSGEKLSSVLNYAADRNLAGIEFAAGIPGTLGGAIFGNAGAYGQAIGDFLIRAKIIDRYGNIRTEQRDYFQFNYRKSRLKTTGEIVLEAEFSLSPGNGPDIREKIDEIISERCRKHPSRKWGCAGSYFKNIDPAEAGQRRTPAGLLLEQVGAKGLRRGKAMVFPGHANFLTNPGGATAVDIRELAEELKQRVRETFGIELEEEVLYVDEWFPTTS